MLFYGLRPCPHGYLTDACEKCAGGQIFAVYLGEVTAVNGVATFETGPGAEIAELERMYGKGPQ